MTSFVRNTEPVYNYKLTDLGKGSTDIAAAVLEKGMNYQSRLVPFPQLDGVEGDHNVHGIVRGRKPGDDARRLIGIVKGTYSIVQHSEFVNMWKPIVSEFPLVQVGAMGQHDTRLVLGFLLDDFNLGGLPTEKVQQFLYTSNCNDGTSGIRTFLAGRRMACLNQFYGLMGNSRLNISVRHGANTRRDIDQWVQYVGKVKDAQRLQRAQLEQLLNPIADTEISDIILAAYPTPRSTLVEQTADLPEQQAIPQHVRDRRMALQAEIARMEDYRVTAVELYDRLVRENPMIAGTGWAALNAVTEAETWRAGRGGADSIVFGERARRIERAYAAAAKVVGIQGRLEATN